jgi:DNA-binding CsgD family transcriptional regulator
MVAEAPNPDAARGAGSIRLLEGDALDPLIQPQCALSVQLRRATGSIVGRTAELTAISQEVREAKTRLAAVTLEGEPGIGKTRLLVAAAEMASAAGFTTVAITADEEIRGPFLVARSLFAYGALRETAQGTPAETTLRRVAEAIAGKDEPGYESLSPDAKLLRAFDLAGIAVNTLANVKPLALLIDDVQWADDDTLRLLRYVVRSAADSPLFLFLSLRPDEFSTVTEAVNFVADMERMGLVRRLRVGRFTPVETGELLRQVLGGAIEGQSVAAMHAQSEGVPFIVEELARTHRDARTLQLIDAEWRLGRNAARLVPSAVRTLISRRAARLPKETLAVLGDAGVLGRSFSMRDLRAIRERASGPFPDDLADILRPAVDAGLLHEHPQGDAADYTFTHEQVREFAVNQLTPVQRRQAHGAVVDLLLENGEPAPEGLPMLARHALAAGDNARAARLSIQAASAALESNAAEEALRLVEEALPVVSSPEDRRSLLITRDNAYAALRRSAERLEGLAELGALAGAMGQRDLEVDVQLRRAAALRAAHDEDAAAELARRVRDRAAADGDAQAELRANLELGQALTKIPLGESFGMASSEVDMAAAEQAFGRAVELAEQVGDDRSLAAATRELGTLTIAKIRDWFVGELMAGHVIEFQRRLAGGESVDHVLSTSEIAPTVRQANAQFQRALEIYERLDDRRGVMSTVIAMAYITYAPVIHLTSSARHLEEIRRVTSRMNELVTESERARQELQMLFGVHVFARAKVVPDLLLARGEEAYRAAKLIGDQATEFNAAGGMAMALVELGDVAEGERWISLAAAVTASAPTPYRARQLELWRGRARAAAGDGAGLRRHLEQAVTMATARGGAAARTEAAAWLALEAARLGARAGDAELLGVAEEAADQVAGLAAVLSGHAPWGAYADAARAEVALARGDVTAAAAAGGAAMQKLEESMTEDAHLPALLSASRGVFAGAPPQIQAQVREWLQLTLSRIAQATVDDAVRVRWLRGPLGRELVELAGGLGDASTAESTAGARPQPATNGSQPATADDAEDRAILRLLTEGQTNREMAESMGITEAAVAEQLARVLGRLGASSRAEATSLAFRGFMVPSNLNAAARPDSRAAGTQAPTAAGSPAPAGAA